MAMEQTKKKLSTTEEETSSQTQLPNPKSQLKAAMEALKPKVKEVSVSLPGLTLFFKTVASRREFVDLTQAASLDAKKAARNSPAKWLRELYALDPGGVVNAGILYRLQVRVEDTEGRDLETLYSREQFYEMCAEGGMFFETMYNIVLMANLGSEIEMMDEEVETLVNFSEEKEADITTGSEPHLSIAESAPGS